jgi:hypothetical protein
VISTSDAAPDPFSAIDGLTLTDYVDVCHALVRTAAGSPRRIEEVLAAHDLTPDRWARISEGWSERIRRHPLLRTEFRRLYAAPPEEAGDRNE